MEFCVNTGLLYSLQTKNNNQMMENLVSQNVIILAKMIILFLCLDYGKFYTNFVTSLNNKPLTSISSKNIYYMY